MSKSVNDVPSKVDLGREGRAYKHKFDGVKVDKTGFAELCLAFEEDIDSIDSEIGLSFVADPANYNRKLRDCAAAANSSQTSITDESEYVREMESCHERYASAQEEQPTIDVNGFVSKYSTGNSTKLSVRVKLSDAIRVLERLTFMISGSVVVILGSE